MRDQDADHPHLKLPEIDDCDHVIQWFFESGMGMSGANGLIALTWQELKSFSDLSGANLSGWESETLINMSRAYTGSYHRSQEPDSPAPWVDDSPETVEQMRANVSAKFKALSAGTLPKAKEPAKKPRKKPKPA